MLVMFDKCHNFSIINTLQQEQDPTNLYIANLPDYVDENYLENMARPFGTVVSTRILRDNSKSKVVKHPLSKQTGITYFSQF